MPSRPATRAAYVKAAGPRYRQAHARLAKSIKRVFPRAKPVFEWGMPGWKVPRPKAAIPTEWKGTMPPTCTYVGLVERKAGLTLHFWYPGDYYLFRKHDAELRAAGLKVMRGCLVHNRKAEFPVEAVERLLVAAKKADSAVAR